MVAGMAVVVAGKAVLYWQTDGIGFLLQSTSSQPCLVIAEVVPSITNFILTQFWWWDSCTSPPAYSYLLIILVVWHDCGGGHVDPVIVLSRHFTAVDFLRRISPKHDQLALNPLSPPKDFLVELPAEFRVAVGQVVASRPVALLEEDSVPAPQQLHRLGLHRGRGEGDEGGALL